MQTIDRNFMEFLGLNGVPFAIIFTKADKLKSFEVEPHVEAYKKEMLQSWESLPPMFITSASKVQGRELLVSYIEGVIKQLQDK